MHIDISLQPKLILFYTQADVLILPAFFVPVQ
mgnify:CR=1 FL=1|jgi:hypothetical protein